MVCKRIRIVLNKKQSVKNRRTLYKNKSRTDNPNHSYYLQIRKFKSSSFFNNLSCIKTFKNIMRIFTDADPPGIF